jgi:hypothetical protein
MRCAADHCDNPIDDIRAAWEARGRRGRPPIYCADVECRRRRNAAQQRKHLRGRSPVRSHRDRPGVHADALRDEHVLAGLDGMDAHEWHARLHEEERLDAELRAWERPKTIRCVTCGEDIGESVRLGPGDWEEQLHVEALPHGANGWRCLKCDREALLAEQQRILEAAQQRG